MRTFLKDTRNQFDLALRRQISWSPAANSRMSHFRQAQRFQDEMRQFLNLFKIPLDKFKDRQHLIAADIGCRDFSTLLPLQEWLRNQGLGATIHGYEIDAHRRYPNLTTRRAWAELFCRLNGGGQFHAHDFLRTAEVFDFIFLLNPFVTPDPLLNWGLPLKDFRPKELVARIKTLLRAPGAVLLSSPNEIEFQIAGELFLEQGFRPIGEVQIWAPLAQGLQKQARVGQIFSL